MSICKRYFWVIACTIITVQGLGQVAHSPFTKFGIGETYTPALANTQGLAGIGVSHPQTWFINNQNPSLLVYNKFTTFQVGLLGESRKLKSSDASEKKIGGNLNYLILAFPCLKNSDARLPARWSSAIGLMPYSSVNYKYQSDELVADNNKPYKKIEEGEGGITQLYWSHGILINKNFSAGLKMSYLFGSINRIHKNQLLSENDNKPIGLVSSVENKTIVKDFTLGLGGSYNRDSLWGSNYRLGIGAVYNFTTDLKSNFLTKVTTLTSSSDTLTADIGDRARGQIHLPASFTTGVSLAKGHNWVVGTEFSYQNFSSFRSGGEKETNSKTAWKIALGGEFTPDPYAIKGILKRTTYRLGASTEQLPFSYTDKQINDYGINFGVSVPTGRSSLDLGFRFGKRGDKTKTILEENYFKVFFGLTFNDQWFIRRKFD